MLCPFGNPYKVAKLLQNCGDFGDDWSWWEKCIVKNENSIISQIMIR